jgi:oligoendopeptidase F
MTTHEQHELARDIALQQYHEILKDLMLRHPRAVNAEMRRLASQLTLAAAAQFHAMQTARLADVKALRNGFHGETK